MFGRKEKAILVCVLIGVGLVWSGLYYFNLISEKVECYSDLDCVPAECCHPVSCVTADTAPDCSDAICTMECRPDTMDCGQGSCVCINKKCFAEIR